MRPKEYYAQYNVQEDRGYIFALIPPHLKDLYIEYIKEPIKSIKMEDRKITCESYIDLETGLDNMDEIWRGIQRAGIIIADITGFDSTVMLLLGVALMKKEKVILIAEKPLEGDPNLPFNLQTLSIRFYDSDKLDELSASLVNLVYKMIVGKENLNSSGVQPDRIASPKPVYEARQPTAERDLNFKIDTGPLRKAPTTVKIKKETIKWENTVEMYAQISDIDDEQGVVYLNCKYKKDSEETFERVFPLKHFKNKDKLKVDQSIVVKVLERPGEVRFLFEEADEDFFDKDVEDISIDGPEYSRIFKPL